MAKNYDSEYQIQQIILTKLGGTGTKCFDSQYSILLEILDKIEGGIGGAQIDDNTTSTTTTWSSSKIVSELANAGFDVQVVQELPATGEAHTLYFVPSTDPKTQNIYDEYLYANNAWEKVGSTAVDMSDYYTKTQVDALLDGYATKVDISTFAQIDDNNVSTGTVFSSAKCDGEYYYDISKYINQKINLYELHNIAANLTDSSTFRVNFRDDNLYMDVELYPLSAAKTETFKQITAENISVILHYYNTTNEYTVNGEWFRFYITYNTNDSRSSGYMYPYFVYSDTVPATIEKGPNLYNGYDIPQSLILFNIYGWDGGNNPRIGSQDWGWFKLDSTFLDNNRMDQWAKVNTYGSHIYPVSNNNNYINYFSFIGTPYIQNGGYIRWDNLIIELVDDPFYLNNYNVYANGLVKDKTIIGEAWNYNINGLTVAFYKPTKTEGFGAGNLFIPTTAGTAGQYLTSNGSGEPIWKDLEVASDYVISDADASAGTYSTDIANFYTKTIKENVVQGVQIKVTKANNVSVYNVSDGIGILNDGDLFVVASEETATIVVNDGTNSHNIIIDASGNITDSDSTGAVVASNVVKVIDGHLYEFNGNSTYTWTSITPDIAFEVIVDSSVINSDSYYLPSSTRIYEGNVELWLMSTEDGQTWENIHYLITGDSITRTVTTGYFGTLPSVINGI